MINHRKSGTKADSHIKRRLQLEENRVSRTVYGTLYGASIVMWGSVPAKQQEEELRSEAALITIPKL